MKRIRWEVRWSRKTGYWGVYRGRALDKFCDTKLDAVRLAAEFCRDAWDWGELSELTIKRRDGTIMDKRTYPRSSDPRKTRG